MRIAFALISTLSMAALAQPAPATEPPAAPPASAPAPEQPAPKPAEAAPATQPAAAAQPATPPPATAQPTTPPTATAQPAAAPAPVAPAVPAAATARTPATVVPARGSAGLTLPVGPPPQDVIRERTKAFLRALKLADPREMVGLSAFPFYLESQRFDDSDALLQEWLKHLRAKRTDLLTLYGIDVYTPAEMEQKYGKAPARLKDLPLRGPTYVAVANLSGHATIIVFRDVDEEWRVIAYSD